MKIRKTLAVATAAVLALGGLGLGGSAASAAPAAEVPVYESGVALTADPYAGWHVGSGNGAAAFDVTANGLELHGKSQVLNGFADDARVSGDAFRAAVESGAVSWTNDGESSPAFFQVPAFFGEANAFTTLRPETPITGLNTASLTENWISSGAIGTSGKYYTAPLGQLLSEMADQSGNVVSILGFGVFADTDYESTVKSISWFGTNYTFLQDAVEPGTVTISGTPTVGSELTANTDGWPEGTAFSYEWFVFQENNGSGVGADAPNYTPTPQNIGYRVGVTVTATLDEHSPSSVSAETAAAVSTPEKPIAPAPVASSEGLAEFLADNGSTPQPQVSAGLPAGALNPGQDHSATVDWTAPDSFVDVYLYSSPVAVGSFPVVNGVAQITLSADVLSKLAAGTHTMVIVGQSSGAVVSVTIELAQGLAATGSDIAVPLGAAAFLVLAGSALLIYRHRRSIA